MRDRVEVFRQIGVNNVGIAPANQPVRFLDGVNRATARSITVSTVLEVRFEDRFEHEFGGGLKMLQGLLVMADVLIVSAEPKVEIGRVPRQFFEATL